VYAYRQHVLYDHLRLGKVDLRKLREAYGFRVFAVALDSVLVFFHYILPCAWGLYGSGVLAGAPFLMR
jgi:hypothetical protein